MSTVLQVLGVAFLVLLALIILGYILIRLFFWRLGSQLGEALEGLTAGTPPRITLVPQDRLAWQDEAQMQRFAAPLPALGFVEAGLWSTREVPGLAIAAFIQPIERVTAVIYEHPAAGVILDMVTRYTDDTSVTYATTEHAGQLDEWPGHQNIHVPDADSETVFRRLLAERPDAEMVPAVASGFKEHFERAYADEMDWRAGRGGASEDEIRRIAAFSGEDYSDEEYAMARELHEREAIADLNYALRERFAEQTTLSVAEWDRISGAIVFIHDGLTDQVLREIFEDWFCEAADAYVWREELPPRERFADVVAQVPEERRPEKLGEVAEPVPADVYTPNREYVSDYDEEDEW